MRKIKMFFGSSALAVALIGAVATKASTKLSPYFYYNTSTHVFVEVDEDTDCRIGLAVQCLWENTNYPIYATASFVSPLKRP